MDQETGWYIINNYAVFGNTVTELCFCKGVEIYVKSLDVNSHFIGKLARILVHFICSLK